MEIAMDVNVLADSIERSRFGIHLSSDEIAVVVMALRAYARPEERYRKDAERYRFLKARRGNIVEIAWNSFYSDIYSTAKMGNVDAAIDKAMAQNAPSWMIEEATSGSSNPA